MRTARPDALDDAALARRSSLARAEVAATLARRQGKKHKVTSVNTGRA